MWYYVILLRSWRGAVQQKLNEMTNNAAKYFLCKQLPNNATNTKQACNSFVFWYKYCWWEFFWGGASGELPHINRLLRSRCLQKQAWSHRPLAELGLKLWGPKLDVMLYDSIAILEWCRSATTEWNVKWCSRDNYILLLLFMRVLFCVTRFQLGELNYFRSL